LSAPNMVKKRGEQSIARAEVRTLDQVSAGGVAFRWRDSEPEMAEARWVSFDEASEMLAFESERGVAGKACSMILALTSK
jgi:hypothetical protein